MKKVKADSIIHNGQVLTINKKMEVIENGVVVMEGDKILAVGDASLLSKYVANKMIDAENGIVMPGMVNAHCHLPMIAFRGLGEEGIEDRLMGYFMPLEKKMLSRQLIHDATLFGAMDMALSGVTTYGDMYYHVDEMAKATATIGLRALLGETIIGFPVVDAPEPYGGFAYTKSILKKFEKYPNVSLALAPHAPYTVSKEKLQLTQQWAKEHHLPIHIHAAEFEGAEKQIADNKKGLTVIAYLEDIGFLGANTILAHCNYVNEADLRIIQKYGCKIAHNPMANAKGATGSAPIVEAMEKGIAVGLGTDGPMGSNVIDLFKVMTYASTVQRLRKMDRTLMTPDKVVRMATMGGAEVLGMQNAIGSLEPRKKADIIIVETKSTNMIPNYNTYASLVFQANPHNVQTTLVDGKVIVENRQLQTVSYEEGLENIQKWMSKIKPFGIELAARIRK